MSLIIIKDGKATKPERPSTKPDTTTRNERKPLMRPRITESEELGDKNMTVASMVKMFREQGYEQDTAALIAADVQLRNPAATFAPAASAPAAIKGPAVDVVVNMRKLHASDASARQPSASTAPAASAPAASKGQTVDAVANMRKLLAADASARDPAATSAPGPAPAASKSPAVDAVANMRRLLAADASARARAASSAPAAPAPTASQGPAVDAVANMRKLLAADERPTLTF